MSDSCPPHSKISTPKIVGSWDYWPRHLVGDIKAAHHQCCFSRAQQDPIMVSFLFLEAVITPEPCLLLIL